MKKFDETFTRIFYEQINRRKVKVKNTLIKSAEDFYKNSIKIINNVLIESDETNIKKSKAKFDKSILNKIFNAQNFTQISANEVFRHSSKYVQENFEIQLDIPLYIFNFSFSKNSKFINTIFQTFSIPFSLKAGTLAEKYQFESNLFKHENEGVNGIIANMGECVLMLLNSDNYNELTIKHELFHYLQIILIESDETNQIKEKFKSIPELQLTVDDLNYLFDEYEFETHIRVELVAFLNELYWKKFSKKMNKQQFLTQFIKRVEKKPKQVISEFFKDIQETRIKNIDRYTALRLFAACYLIEDSLYLLNAINWLETEFNV
jgi:hypothetical protein